LGQKIRLNPNPNPNPNQKILRFGAKNKVKSKSKSKSENTKVFGGEIGFNEINNTRNTLKADPCKSA
jgi:hypothetical protein